ncbi:MAG: CBS domain-containing protein [Planctomycetota bacterium]
MNASDIMTPNVLTIGADATIREAIDLLIQEGISGLPVVDTNGCLIGIVTEFALLAIAYDRNVCEESVSDHMTREVLTVEADEPVNKVADLCIVNRVRRVPVLEGGRLAGLISRRDVLRAVYESQKAESGSYKPACVR